MTMCAPVRSTEPPIRAPMSLISPREVNWCSIRIAPPVRILSAWMARWPRPSMTVSTHSRRPPISDSHSQIAALRDVLALVRCAPVIWLRDRSRSRRIRSPLPSRPGRPAQPVSDSSNSSAPSATSGESNSHPAKRSGNGTSSPVRSRQPDNPRFPTAARAGQSGPSIHDSTCVARPPVLDAYRPARTRRQRHRHGTRRPAQQRRSHPRHAPQRHRQGPRSQTSTLPRLPDILPALRRTSPLSRHDQSPMTEESHLEGSPASPVIVQRAER